MLIFYSDTPSSVIDNDDNVKTRPPKKEREISDIWESCGLRMNPFSIDNLVAFSTKSKIMAKLFISYSHADEHYKIQLEKHLAILRRRGDLDIWHDRRIMAGEEFGKKIDAHLNEADIIVFLVSHNFIASDYCYEIEMARALERHETKEAHVIPIILDDCLWKGAPFGKITALPTDGKPVAKFANVNEGYTNVAEGIEKVAQEINSSEGKMEFVASPSSTAQIYLPLPRSTNLHVKLTPTQFEKDKFVVETFEFISRYFEGSLDELPKRNPSADIKTDFDRIDSNTFSALVYLNGNKKCECSISRKKGMMGGDISYLNSAQYRSGSMNDCLSITEQDGILCFTAMMAGMKHSHNPREDGLSQEGAAEYFWERFIEPLQR